MIRTILLLLAAGMVVSIGEYIHAEDKPDSKTLISNLASEDFQVRESAQKELISRGRESLARYWRLKFEKKNKELDALKADIEQLAKLLREASQADDPELKRRAGEVCGQLRAAAEPRMAAYRSPIGPHPVHRISLFDDKCRFIAQLPDDKSPAADPAWSPDGGRIAFASMQQNQNEIWVMQYDGSKPKALTQNGAKNLSPVWSPDGRRIAFVSWRKDGKDICVIDADGTNERRLTQDDPEDYQPAWSPDGGQIAFVSLRDGDQEIYVINADGKNLRRLTEAKGEDSRPAWKPDGTKIAFTSQRDGHREVYVMDADGKNQKRLTDNERGNWSPAWSPDGNRIAILSMRDEERKTLVPDDQFKTEVYVMDADGGHQTRLTTNCHADDPVWSPDGAKIAFAASPHGLWGNWVCVMDADGKNRMNSPSKEDTPGNYTAPRWSPICAPEISELFAAGD